MYYFCYQECLCRAQVNFLLKIAFTLAPVALRESLHRHSRPQKMCTTNHQTVCYYKPMKTKRYWLRGGAVGLIVSFFPIGLLLHSFFKCSNSGYRGGLCGIEIPISLWLLVILVFLGIFVGWLYEKK